MIEKNSHKMKKIKEKFDNNIVIFKKSFDSLKNEGKESKEIFDLLLTKVKTKEKLSKDEIKMISEQLKDIGKISFMIPFVLLPGAPITIPIIYKLADLLKIDLIPSSFKDNQLKENEIEKKDIVEINNDLDLK